MVTQVGAAKAFRKRGNMSANSATRATRRRSMSRGKYKSVAKGIPALVCVPTGETVIIDGRKCKILKLMYDLKGEYMPPAMIIPR